MSNEDRISLDLLIPYLSARSELRTVVWSLFGVILKVSSSPVITKCFFMALPDSDEPWNPLMRGWSGSLPPLK